MEQLTVIYGVLFVLWAKGASKNYKFQTDQITAANGWHLTGDTLWKMDKKERSYQSFLKLTSLGTTLSGQEPSFPVLEEENLGITSWCLNIWHIWP